jgi:hypothetical protein
VDLRMAVAHRYEPQRSPAKRTWAFEELTQN